MFSNYDLQLWKLTYIFMSYEFYQYFLLDARVEELLF